ncbi:MAG: hypothetical protein E2590_12815 [Chryseobacterium sp.]|nr:hypothetical protein [Chryseobacterium sp.]
MNRVKFKRQNGGLARLVAGEDHISGLLIYGKADIDKSSINAPEELEEKGITLDSDPALMYHVNEFYRQNPGAKLYFQCIEDSDGEYTEVKVLQNYAGGSIRQMGVINYKVDATDVSAMVANLDQVCKDLRDLNTPISLVCSMNMTASELISLVDLHDLDAENVSVVIGQDAGGLGNYLSTENNSIGMVGSVLGVMSKAKVNESIGWIEKFDLISTAYSKKLTNDVQVSRELDVLGFIDGSKLEDYTPLQIQSLIDKGYIFAIKETGQTGSYCNDSFTATDLESDYAYIENNRTTDKALRLVNKVLTPKIQSPAYVDPDTGYLDPSTVASLEALADDELDQMKRDGEISGYSVYINPDQAVLRNSKLEVVIMIVPTGTLREITVKLGLTLQIS